MTRIELFKALCTVADTLEKVIPTVAGGEPLSAVLATLDALIDRCVREGLQPLHDGDTSRCPACGQATCTHWQYLTGRGSP